jgi:hypothetical protein
MAEVRLASRRGNPHGGECGGTPTRLRDRELLHRAPKPLPDQRYWRQSNQTIIVVVGPT